LPQLSRAIITDCAWEIKEPKEAEEIETVAEHHLRGSRKLFVRVFSHCLQLLVLALAVATDGPPCIFVRRDDGAWRHVVCHGQHFTT
jgi:hypothetical protein